MRTIQITVREVVLEALVDEHDVVTDRTVLAVIQALTRAGLNPSSGYAE